MTAGEYDALPAELISGVRKTQRNAYRQGYAAAIVQCETALLAGEDALVRFVYRARREIETPEERRQRERDEARAAE